MMKTKLFFVKVDAFLIKHSLLVGFAFLLVGFSIGMHYRVKNIRETVANEQEVQEHILELYESIADVCELGGNVWSWEDRVCYSPNKLRKIRQHRPAQKGLI